MPRAPTPPTPTAPAVKTPYRCPTCRSTGFNRSRMINRCSFCDGTDTVDPPTPEEVWIWNIKITGDDPCDEVMP